MNTTNSQQLGLWAGIVDNQGSISLTQWDLKFGWKTIWQRHEPLSRCRRWKFAYQSQRLPCFSFWPLHAEKVRIWRGTEEGIVITFELDIWWIVVVKILIYHVVNSLISLFFIRVTLYTIVTTLLVFQILLYRNQFDGHRWFSERFALFWRLLFDFRTLFGGKSRHVFQHRYETGFSEQSGNPFLFNSAWLTAMAAVKLHKMAF